MGDLRMQRLEEPSSRSSPHGDSMATLSQSTIGNEVQLRMAGGCTVSSFIPPMLSIAYLRLTVVVYQSGLLIDSSVRNVPVPGSNIVCLH